ncbi:MAG TPA: YdiU family protein [Microlunatus sp.]
MSVTTPEITLGSQFASELSELAVPWRAEKVAEPLLLVLDEELAAELGIDPAWFRSPDGLSLLTGNQPPPGATPVAQAYAGHQFGGYNPRLGDGRALLLGELRDPSGRLHDLHLKGSGPTPFSRGGDGLAAVGPMLREYVVSTAMHALGIPTTRSLAVVATGRGVQRETLLPGAVLARVASSHLRVGTFQYARARDDVDLLRRLADVAIDRHHPTARDADDPYLALFAGVVDAQASLLAQWMLVGFVHGVMNTDNMTISAETIDYGPCAFLDAIDPTAVFSSIDHGGRYAYGQQPVVAEWNLARLAEALLPLFADDQAHAVALAERALAVFRARYSAAWTQGMWTKLGLDASLLEGVDETGAGALLDDLVRLMQAERVDYTSFFRDLAWAARGERDRVHGQVADRATLDGWLERWFAFGPNAYAMDRVNPIYVPRNHLVEDALDAATFEDLVPLARLVEVLRDPFTARPGLARYAEPAPADFGPYRTFCGT